MRLICPNCGAQYEVDARVIPDTGRDVQCSNCGHTWFQRPAHLDQELAEELGYELPHEDPTPGHVETEETESVVPEFDETPEFETSVAIEESESAEPVEDLHVPEPVRETTGGEVAEVRPEPTEILPVFETEDTAAEPEEEETEARPAAQSGSALKDSVRDILRAEVEFDQAMRQSQGETLETQPDLGLEEPAQDSAKKSLRDRMARLRGLDPADSGIVAGSVAAATGKRRDLLPDIEEINSTLSASSERNEDGTVPDEDTRRARAERSGFRSVFLVLVLAAIMLVALYVLAPVIAEKVPALAGVMESYVTAANAFRVWLDRLLSSASVRLNALLGQLNS
ncbi:zinc-ribbon domain-containing protein [Celeribacter sp. SCSIO 80788]|uniref:zinc-ribbon domain-containing protein n=1 Tax=Celeribacter sp. SCSIO 80788 TaxID=3117013 RepID=UPI003DA556C4